MGKYRPTQRSSKLSISETLELAEGDHLRDCPDATFAVRCAAILLDLIFLGLMGSGLDRLLTLAIAYLSIDPNAGVFYTTVPLLTSLRVGVEACFIYLYWIQSVKELGGTPAKILLKLRVVESETGQRLSYYQVILREFFGKSLSILFLGFLWPLVRRDKKTLHDLISGSVVKIVESD